MVSRILFWGGFGVAVRFWQLGLEMRPAFNRSSLWVYPIFAGVGGSFGYWLQGVDERQNATLEDRKAAILEKRAKRAAREADAISAQHA
ncbi:NADH2 dehydrogenase subunit 14K [Seiridium cupressi]